jgi:hypothetical protein
MSVRFILFNARFLGLASFVAGAGLYSHTKTAAVAVKNSSDEKLIRAARLMDATSQALLWNGAALIIVSIVGFLWHKKLNPPDEN